jgi:hypothetical protein
LSLSLVEGISQVSIDQTQTITTNGGTGLSIVNTSSTSNAQTWFQNSTGNVFVTGIQGSNSTFPNGLFGGSAYLYAPASIEFYTNTFLRMQILNNMTQLYNNLVVEITNGDAIFGSSINNYGLRGQSTNEYGVYGSTSNYLRAGVYGTGSALGVLGSTVVGVGVRGFSQNGIGVEGHASQNNEDGDDEWDFLASGSAPDWGSISSRRWKTNIESISDPLTKVNNLRGVYYDWIPEKGGRHDIGFIAEEVGEVLPEIVSYEENRIDAIAMDYTKIPALLVEAIKELDAKYQREIQVLRAEIAALKTERRAQD